MKLRCMAASGGQGAGNSIKQGVFKDKTSKKVGRIDLKIISFFKTVCVSFTFYPNLPIFLSDPGEKKLSSEKKLFCERKKVVW